MKTNPGELNSDLYVHDFAVNSNAILCYKNLELASNHCKVGILRVFLTYNKTIPQEVFMKFIVHSINNATIESD